MPDEHNWLVLVGHPFAPIGMGEHVRCSFRALRAVGVDCAILDVYDLNRRDDPDWEREFADRLVRRQSRRVNIFHINGDEVEQTLAHLGGLDDGAYNIVYPLWELSNYPPAWAEQLERFDEVWVPSRFVLESISRAVRRPVFCMPMACEARLSAFLGRRYYGIPESSYAFLFLFDFTSYVDRKNPFAVIRAFEQLCQELPSQDVLLIVKLNSSDERKADRVRFADAVDRIKRLQRVLIIDKTLTSNEMWNLIRCCDCFVSMHRAEGFGRGMAEAMSLGKPVIGTRYGGNLEFMKEENACLVSYRLVDVGGGEYPHGFGQVWAEPDVKEAVERMRGLVEDRDLGRQLGMRASRYMRLWFNYRACGLKYADRLGSLRRSFRGDQGSRSTEKLVGITVAGQRSADR